jgi:Flp pilus assembly protein TadD
MTAATPTLLALMIASAGVVSPTSAQDSASTAPPVDHATVLLEIGRVDDAIGLLRQRVASAPGNARAHAALGTAYYLARRPGEAMTEWRSAIALDSTAIEPRRDLANAFTDAGQPDSAIAVFRRVIALDSTDAKGYVDLGVALDQKGQLDEAIAQWKHATTIDPNDALTWYNLGSAYARLQQWPAAWDALITATDINEWLPDLFETIEALSKQSSSDLERLVKGSPADTMAHYYLAYAFAFRHDWGKATSEIDRAIVLDPSRPLFHKAKGMIASRQRHNSDAIKSFQDCITHDGANWACLNLLGWSYNALGEPNRAREALLAAAHINPNVIGIQENLLLSYVMSERWEEGAASGEHAIALGSTYPPVRLNLVTAYMNLRKYDLAWWQLRIAEHMGYAPPQDMLRALASLSPEPHW